MKYNQRVLEEKAKEWGVPISKAIMFLENPPEKLENIECGDCKNKKKTIIIEKE